MAIDFFTDTRTLHRETISPRILWEPSTAVPFKDQDVLAWAKTFRENTLKFTTSRDYESHVLGVDPFSRANDGRYLIYLADDGTLKEMVPADRRKDCLNDPEFCRQMLNLSQEGRLFVRNPGEVGFRQVQTTSEDDNYYIGLTPKGIQHNLAPRAVSAPPAPKAPPFWKYLLYPFSQSVRNEFKKYNEDTKYFREHYDELLAQNEVYAKNLENTLRQLDNNGLDEDALDKELEQHELAREQWEFNNYLQEKYEKMQRKGISTEQIQTYEREMHRLRADQNTYRAIRPLEFHSDEQMLQIAYHSSPDAHPGRSYMEALNDMDGGEVDVRAWNPDRRASIVKFCIQHNLAIINRYSTRDPEYRRLLEMNEALLAYANKNVRPTYSIADEYGDNLKNLAKEHKLHVNMFNVRRELLASKANALDHNWEHEYYNQAELDALSSGILSEVLRLTDAVQKMHRTTKIDPITRKFGEYETSIHGLIATVKDAPAFEDLCKLPKKQTLDILCDRERLLAVAEKIVGDPIFQKMQRVIGLDEQLEEAKAFGLYGDKSTLKGPKIEAFHKHLQDAAEVKTDSLTTDVLKKEDATVESYCEAVAQIMEKQMAEAMLRKLETVPEEEKNIFLVRHRRPFRLMARDLREYVSENIDKGRIQAVINEGYEKGYVDNPERKEEILAERLRFVQNGLKEFCASNPDLAEDLNLQQVVQTNQAQHQIEQSKAPSMGGLG